MGLCCPLYGGDDEGPSFYRINRPCAKKEHLCYECREAIQPGTRYELYTGKWDGEMNTYKTCLSCAEIRDHFACGGFLFGELWNDLKENFFPSMTAGGPCFTGLSIGARLRLFDRRLTWMAGLDKHARLRLVTTKPKFKEDTHDEDAVREMQYRDVFF